MRFEHVLRPDLPCHHDRAWCVSTTKQTRHLFSKHTGYLHSTHREVMKILQRCIAESSFRCRQWEDIDHDVADSLAGALTSAGSNSDDGNGDPLGLGVVIE